MLATALVKEQKSRSSAFLCSETKRKRLLRRRTKYKVQSTKYILTISSVLALTLTLLPPYLIHLRHWIAIFCLVEEKNKERSLKQHRSSPRHFYHDTFLCRQQIYHFTLFVLVIQRVQKVVYVIIRAAHFSIQLSPLLTIRVHSTHDYMSF